MFSGEGGEEGDFRSFRRGFVGHVLGRQCFICGGEVSGGEEGEVRRGSDNATI